MKSRSVFVGVAAVALLATACGAKGSSSESEGAGSGGSTTTAAASAMKKFGTLDSPCGAGDATIKPDEAGKGADKLYLGTSSDRGSTIRPGLLGELYDTAKAYADWCNEQGGIAGLKIEVVDLDGKLLEVEKAMVTACTDTFAMVGGGNALDSGQFSGKAESDFHKCKLIDVPAFSNQPQKTDSNGYVAPIPNRTSPRSVTFWQKFAEDHPEEIKKNVEVFSDAVQYNEDQIMSTLNVVPGWKTIDEVNYAAAGDVDYKPIAQRVKQAGAEVVNLVGEPVAGVQVLKSMAEDNFTPWVLGEANMYGPEFLKVGKGTEKLVVRTVAHPFEEADRWPGTRSFVDIMEAYKAKEPAAKIAGLGVQAMSAWLLFSTAAKECGTTGDKVISRDCVMKNLKTVSSWTGGGMHAETNPAKNLPSKCVMALTVKDAKWVRLWPELDSADDNGDGFLCHDDGVLELPDLAKKYAGAGKVDPSRDS